MKEKFQRELEEAVRASAADFISPLARIPNHDPLEVWYQERSQWDRPKPAETVPPCGWLQFGVAPWRRRSLPPCHCSHGTFLNRPVRMQGSAMERHSQSSPSSNCRFNGRYQVRASSNVHVVRGGLQIALAGRSTCVTGGRSMPLPKGSPRLCGTFRTLG